ncbi:MAG: hypothetical protein H6594_01880 [Flavobacteriales bacterium]|nr:hypothetical protein [Flavobacteriales bacterium]
MRRNFILIAVIVPLNTFGQIPSFDGIVEDVCDSLKSIEGSLEELSYEQSIEIVRKGIVENPVEWEKAHSDFNQIRTGDDYIFLKYFEHISQLACPQYRIIDIKMDTYLYDNPELRSLYLTTKSFIGSAEDNLGYHRLSEFLRDSIQGEDTNILLTDIEKHMDEYEKISSLSIILVYINGYTFRVRYSDLKTGHTIFQLDVIFKDNKDQLIDSLVIKKKDVLEVERLENIEYYKKVESGEIKIPPPPPPSMKKK